MTLTAYRLLQILTLSLFTSEMYAQRSDESCCLERPPTWIIKFAPLSLLDPDNTIQFGVERLLNRRHTIQAELGYGWQGISLWDMSSGGRFSAKEIWRGRAEWRLYLEQPKALGSYLAIEGFYKQVNALEQGIGGIPCVSPCPTPPTGRFPALKHVWSGNLKVGYQMPQSTDRRLLLDLYGGLGVRYASVSRPDLPTGIVLSEAPSLFGSWPSFPFMPRTTVSLVVGIKFGYAF